MSRRDRIEYAAFIALGLLALVLAGWRLYEYKQNQVEQRQEAARDYANRAYGKAQEACASSATFVDRVNCLFAEMEAKERDKYTQYDLEAQQDMAFWALCMFTASLIGLAVTVYGVIYVVRAFGLNREALFADQRPWIRIDAEVASGLRFDEPDAYVHLRLVQSNTGKTPAIAVNMWRRFVVKPKTHEEVAEAFDAFVEEQRAAYSANLGIDIFPGQEFEATYKMTIPITDLRQQGLLGTFVPPTPVLLFWCGYRATDSDVLHETARAEFLFDVGIDGHDRAGIAWDVQDIPAHELRLVPVEGCRITL